MSNTIRNVVTQGNCYFLPTTYYLLLPTYYFLSTTYYIEIMFELILSLDTQLTLWFNGSDSLFVDTLATIATKTRTWVPLGALLMYVLVKMKNWKHLLLIILGIALAITLAVSPRHTVIW